MENKTIFINSTQFNVSDESINGKSLCDLIHVDSSNAIIILRRTQDILVGTDDIIHLEQNDDFQITRRLLISTPDSFSGNFGRSIIKNDHGK